MANRRGLVLVGGQIQELPQGDRLVQTIRPRQFTQLSGRFEIDVDNDWACWSDLNFGPSLQDWDLDLGNGAEPLVDWDGMGLAFPAGATLNRIFVKCRANTDDVDTIEVFARMHDVDITAGDPIDTNAEVNPTTILPATIYDLDAGVGQANDIRSFEIDLGNYTVVNEGADLHLSVRAPVGTTTANRQLRTTMFIEWQHPEFVI